MLSELLLAFAQNAGAGDVTTWLEVVSRAAELVLLIVAIVALFVSGRQANAASQQSRAAEKQSEALDEQLRRDAEREKRNRSFRLMERWNDPTLDSRRGRVAGFLRNDPSADEIRDHRRDDDGFRSDLSLVLNFLEEAAVAWNREELSRDAFVDFFGGIVLTYWDWLEPWVYQYRQDRDQQHPRLDAGVARGIWVEFERMHEEIERRIRMMNAQGEPTP